MRTDLWLRTVALLAATGILLTAESSHAQGVQGGVLGGVTFSNISNLTEAIDFGGEVDVESRTGGVIGPFVAFPLSERVALQFEALFGTKGATPTDGTNRLEIKFTYLDIPVLFRLAPSPTGPLYFLLGPSVNINLSAKTIDFVPTRVEEDAKDDVKNTEFGLVFAAGAGSRNLFVEGRYSLGLTDIGDAPFLTAPIRNRAFAVLAGVRFGSF
jgi:hypothetical protein